ncbi:MAG: orotate phosphoribosyltransferase [Alphaproteobacteria bacterium]|jgi:orotate phosphoribosyltransferase|nr:orotate phosphoribosyltransferase [Alphaproteobacteria bacterium]
MTPDQVLAEFAKAGALLKGHFILSSGRHSDMFLQKALVFQYPKQTAKLCKALAEKIKAKVKKPIHAIVSPAVGGIIPGYETARHLGVPAMFVERQDGVFTLRRNFQLDETSNVIVVEDVISTGLSSREAIDAVRKTGAKVLALACLVDRSAGAAKFDVPFIPLAKIKVQSWEADKLPKHLIGTPAVKPGSRGLK